MQPTAPQLPPLSEYRDPSEVQSGLNDYYRTKQSFSWFVRRNRDRLVESGALIIVAGRMKFHPALTEEVVKEAGRLAALGGGEQ
jgi:hypothetical protein